MDVCGGVLLPSVSPNAGLHELWDPYYEPLWELCEELDLPINVHSGSGIPDYGDLEPARAIMLIELPWFAHRPLWHLMFGGVFDRHPTLRMSLTEQGVAWVPRGLDTIDWFYKRMTTGGAAEAVFFGAVAKSMSMLPSEYFRKHVMVGASFLRPSEAPLIPTVGVDRIMWGHDYPHSEGTYPYTTEGLRCAFAGLPPDRRAAHGRRQRGRVLRLRLRRAARDWRPHRSPRRRRRPTDRTRAVPVRFHLQRVRA